LLVRPRLEVSGGEGIAFVELKAIPASRARENNMKRGRLTAGGWLWALAVLAMAAVANAASAKDYTVTVSAPDHDYREAPVRFTVAAPRDFAGAALFEKDTPIPVQARLLPGSKAEVTFIVHSLAKGQSEKYRLMFERNARPVPESGVIIDKTAAGDVDIRINNELFARYDTHTGPNKPYFYPVNGPGGKQMVRHYPFETLPNESHDHPHHRGLWFTHGDVNGEDYWSEEPRAAKTVNTGFEEVQSGPVCGYFRAKTDWISREGKKIAEDTREVRVYNVPDGRLMDFEVTMKPVGGPLVFGDTKEGSFGLRVPDSIRVVAGKEKGQGHIETSEGIRDAATWGKPANWVDYYGPVEGETLGIAIFDSPSNFRHPETWHVRDYGLFAANPFGLHDFNNDKQHPKLGEHTVPEGQTITFRYRLFFHKGTTAEANIPAVWSAYSDPPKVEVR